MVQTEAEKTAYDDDDVMMLEPDGRKASGRRDELRRSAGQTDRDRRTAAQLRRLHVKSPYQTTIIENASELACWRESAHTHTHTLQKQTWVCAHNERSHISTIKRDNISSERVNLQNEKNEKLHTAAHATKNEGRMKETSRIVERSNVLEWWSGDGFECVSPKSFANAHNNYNRNTQKKN